MPPYRADKRVNRTTRKHNNKYQTTNIIYDQKSVAIINKIITKSNSHQIKPKQNNLTYVSLEKIGDLSSMRLFNWSINKSNEVRSSKIRFHF